MAEAVEDAFRYGKLVLATTTYNMDIFPFMKQFIEHLTERNFQNRTIGIIENGSWAPAAKLNDIDIKTAPCRFDGERIFFLRTVLCQKLVRQLIQFRFVFFGHSGFGDII